MSRSLEGSDRAFYEAQPGDRWLDPIIDVDCIDEGVARLAIADALAIDNPENVVIEQVGFCQAC